MAVVSPEEASRELRACAMNSVLCQLSQHAYKPPIGKIIVYLDGVTRRKETTTSPSPFFDKNDKILAEYSVDIKEEKTDIEVGILAFRVTLDGGPVSEEDQKHYPRI